MVRHRVAKKAFHGLRIQHQSVTSSVSCPKHDRRIGRMGDWTEHLCPCPSKLRWALPAGARRQLAKGGRTDRWPQMFATPSRTNPLLLYIPSYDHPITAYARPRTASTILLVARVRERPPAPGPQFQGGPSARSCAP